MWNIEADGTVDDVQVIDALRTDGVVTGGVSDEATALLLAGNTYALTESEDIGLFTFGADGTFTELAQFEDEQSWEVIDDQGNWSVTADGVISIAFPGEVEADDATVLQGLGEDFMTVQTGDDEVQQVTRIVPLEDPAWVTGSFSILDDVTGAASEAVEMSANFTGVHVGEDGVAEDFEWGLTADGRLVVTVAGDTAFDTETLTFHLLAGSSGDLLRFVVVHRENGALRVGDADAGEAPDALSVVTLLRTR